MATTNFAISEKWTAKIRQVTVPSKSFGGCVLVKKGEELGRTNGSKDITPFPLQKRVPQPSVFF